jgi:hypothetical protein
MLIESVAPEAFRLCASFSVRVGRTVLLDLILPYCRKKAAGKRLSLELNSETVLCLVDSDSGTSPMFGSAYSKLS